MAKYSIKLYCFLILSWRAWRSMANPESFSYDDRMGWHEKRKIISLSKDLFKESLLNLRQIIEIRNEHDTLIAFNVGMIMGRIREKYRWMMETYRDILDQYENRHFAKPPSTRELRSMHLVIALEMMHYFEIEIDKLVDVLIDEGSDDLKFNRVIIGQTEPRAWWKDDDTTKTPNKTEEEKLEDANKKQRPRPGGPADVFDGPGPDAPPPQKGGVQGPKPSVRMRAPIDIQREQKEKSRLREQFLMKKLGMSANMTTMKKRFMRHWPVEDTWTLDKYNQDYK